MTEDMRLATSQETQIPEAKEFSTRRTRSIDGVLGAVAGDVIGSVYERHVIKTETFPLFGIFSRFTDDSIMTVATADALLSDGDYARAYRSWGRAWPDAGYGGKFSRWLRKEHASPYGSFGNGSAMRASPAAYAADSLEEVLRIAEATSVVTHDHPQGILGAQALAGSVFPARRAASNGTDASCKEEVRAFLERRCGYSLLRSVAEIRPDYTFDVTCQGSVPESLTCFLEASDFESAVRKAVSLGGDADTQACIAGAVAGALWGVPEHIWKRVRSTLHASMLRILDAFEERFGKE